MILKLTALICLMGVFRLLYPTVCKHQIAGEAPIDKAWWDALSPEWKTILLINQNFSRQQTDLYKVQHGYINRLNSENEDDYSEMNKSLHELNEMNKFGLGYPDFYARALRYKFVTANDHIDLATLGDLDKIYMVNGPGDLTPLKKFTKLKVLILNDCGIDDASPLHSPVLNLQPLRYLNKLQVLHCSSNNLGSLEPVKDLTNLLELRLDNSSVKDLSPLKNLVNLELLSVGSKVENASVIARLVNLKALYLSGCKRVPDLSKLKKLTRLALGENELAVIDGSYRITNIAFLEPLSNLEYLDLDNSSYRGSLSLLDSFQQLKAITLPPVSSTIMREFKEHHSSCIIINAYRYER